MTEETKQPEPHSEQTQPETAVSAEVTPSTEGAAYDVSEELSIEPEGEERGESDETTDATDMEEEEGQERLPKVSLELHQLVDLSTKYEEIGPIVASLAMRLGYSKIAERVVRLGLDKEECPVEFYFVAARLAREEGRFGDVLQIALDAVQSVVDARERGDEVPATDKTRLLFVVRLAFVTLMFSYEDIRSVPEFPAKLSELFGKLADFYADDAFFHQLYAQTLWFSDEIASEEEWEKALELGDPEDIWNSRGTWHKEASKNIKWAEAAYRRGLEKNAESALLMHNIAQILMDRAEEGLGEDLSQAVLLLNEGEGFLRRAKRVAHRVAMRNHIFDSLDRLRKMKTQIEQMSRLPEVGDVLTGRVISLKDYGVFVVLPSGHTGLLHSSEIDHYWVEDATTRYNENDAIEVKVIAVEKRREGDGSRISLSRKVLIEKPADFDEELSKPPSMRSKKSERGGRRRSSSRRNQGRSREGQSRGGKKRGGEREPKQYRDTGSVATIADLLSAKLNLRPSKED